MVLFNIIRYYYFAYFPWGSVGVFLTTTPVILGIIIIPCLLLGLYYISGYYVVVSPRSRIDDLLNTLITTFIASLLIYFMLIVNDSIRERGTVYELIGILWALFFGCTFAARLTVTTVLRRSTKRDWSACNTLIIGTLASAQKIAGRLSRQNNSREFNVVGFITFDNAESDVVPTDIPVFPAKDVEQLVEKMNIRRLIVLPHPNGVNATMQLLGQLFVTGCSIFISPVLFRLISGKTSFGNVAGEPLIDISRPDISPMTAACKRASDIVGSIIALILLSPVMAITALAVKLDSKGPVFFLQERVGLHKRKFRIIKFRTMRPDAEDEGPALSSVNDARVTRVGHFLRKYRLDELPQFVNVLLGDMSIVGPRPEREYYINQIVKRVPYYSLIHCVRPGITSWGMVKYGYATDVDQMVERLSYDLLYIENISMGVDLKIVAYTVKTVLTGRGL